MSAKIRGNKWGVLKLGGGTCMHSLSWMMHKLALLMKGGVM